MRQVWTMKHARLAWDLVAGFVWSLAVAVTAAYLAINEEYLGAFDRWRE